MLIAPVWTSEGIETVQVDTAKLTKLPYGHVDYFKMEQNHVLMPIRRLLSTRARADGVPNACGYMKQAAAGEIEKREPVVIERRGGSTVVVEGNSTFINALYSGWPDIPCRLIETSPSVEGFSPGGVTLEMDVAMAEAREFMERYDTPYHELLGDMVSAAQEAARAVGKETVFEIYTRKKKQIHRDTKDVIKIAGKLIEKRAENRDFQLREMVDIVGATVVVYYSDRIGLFLDVFESRLAEYKLALEPYEVTGGGTVLEKIHREKGYHATHVKVVSTDSMRPRLKAEVQVKTMLHDAWGAKLHDLTYKPGSVLDPKLKALMESFGNSLQAIEVQSETLRDAILEGTRPLERLRIAARIPLMETLRLWNDFHDSEVEARYKICLDYIEENSSYLAACARDDKNMKVAVELIESVKPDAAQLRLSLTVFLASFRIDNELGNLVERALEDWREEDEPDDFDYLHFASASYHQTNRIDDAISSVRRFLDEHAEDPRCLIPRLNLANYLIEASISQPAQRVREEIEVLLGEVRSRAGDPEAPDETALKSTESAFKVVFGDEKEVKEGLEIQQQVLAEVESMYRGFAEMYLALGWQRRFREF
ncbi:MULTISPECIES: hypothetical protein [unclassified Rhizobium]|uniref:hypothetical protein n=1 Tax=unclassified Rhizobium TaxID=2613769 RepID=UPI001ADC6F8F|nr:MULTISPECIES: hypothetical protein [unclassified Rhizobium]MBO9101111.1 hypothetical protein [Rhizobium sp. L58/93]MBO9168375.1 hypothetical protein [Rhizobium sp. L245/93]QXZ88177.1 hypothetical protein J5287_31180 [Rhizobium sp. K1/93]QXZ94351.1 hypothetical protein J5280_30715 [Rhizobium sp. K15/93]QYA05755.1 hypothetical protein J5278_29920 [Rhizobium sp. B21/90]